MWQTARHRRPRAGRAAVSVRREFRHGRHSARLLRLRLVRDAHRTPRTAPPPGVVPALAGAPGLPARGDDPVDLSRLGVLALGFGLDEVDKGPQRRRHMPAAVVVEVGAIEHLAPVFENGHQAAVIECLAEELLEEIDDSQSVDGGFDPQVMGGGHQLAARRNTQPLTILLELEDTYLAVLEAVPDQLVFG